MTSPKLSKPDPHVARTRKLLEDAFRSLMVERPSCDISVGEIAERATVNRATFYTQFEDLRHLATSVLRDDLLAAMRSSLACGTPLDAESAADVATDVYEFFDGFFRTKHRTTGERELSIGATLQETILSFFRAWLADDPRWMRSFPGASAEDVATALSWTVYGGALRWSGLSHRLPARRSARELVGLLIGK